MGTSLASPFFFRRCRKLISSIAKWMPFCFLHSHPAASTYPPCNIRLYLHVHITISTCSNSIHVHLSRCSIVLQISSSSDPFHAANLSRPQPREVKLQTLMLFV
jgi:hypothetical protein